MKLLVNEIFTSIQGEGADTGMPAVFVRMAGCNMDCSFCDTDYSVKEKLYNDDLIERILDASDNLRYVIFTGGEPLTQNIIPIIKYFWIIGYRIGLETNGTIGMDKSTHNMIHSLSLSPKVSRVRLSLDYCTSLKILYPYLPNITADSFIHYPCVYKGIQPVDDTSPEIKQSNFFGALHQVQKLGEPWRLSVQMHKLINFK